MAPNHQSYLDPPLVGAGCPRRLNYLARKSLFRFAPFRWLIRSLDAIPLDTKGIGFGGMKETLRRLRRGEMVLVFPEGSRTWDGEIGPFQPGFTALATRGRAAILPVAIDGAFEAWPRWRALPRPGVIHVHYGVPVSAEEAKRLGEQELVAEVRRRVCAAQAMLRRGWRVGRGRPPPARLRRGVWDGPAASRWLGHRLRAGVESIVVTSAHLVGHVSNVPLGWGTLEMCPTEWHSGLFTGGRASSCPAHLPEKSPHLS